MKTKLIAGGVAALTAITLSPVTHADPGGNVDEFDQYLISHGIYNDTAMNGISYLQNGRNACASGSSNFEQYLLQQGMDRAGASDVAFAAHHYLCPGR